ncbi:MAG TPA: helix-turn-helix transcriptional regulator [Nocardioidaceae bacterium]|nr:helix-turn-helix transcriptional regulator [Nocardioidaceae bacterium]
MSAAGVAAIESRDGEALLDSAGRLQRFGLALWAADLLAVGATYPGMPRAAARSLRTAALKAAVACEGAATPALRALDVRMTATQRRVAELAATGLSNRQVGEALGISTRTAETHLHRVYRVLGVHRREDLGGVLPDGG